MRVLCKFIFIVSAAVTTIMGVATTRADSRVTLTYAYEGYGPTHKALIDELRSRMKAFFHNDLGPYGRDDFFSSALVDLNGDNIDEMIVVADSGIWCGTSLECDASVYQLVEGSWRYVGVVSAYLSPNGPQSFTGSYVIDDFYVNIEDREGVGWRTLNDGKYRYCWVKRPPDKLLPGNEDQFFMPHISGQPGYFWSVSMDKKCPDR